MEPNLHNPAVLQPQGYLPSSAMPGDGRYSLPALHLLDLPAPAPPANQPNNAEVGPPRWNNSAHGYGAVPRQQSTMPSQAAMHSTYRAEASRLPSLAGVAASLPPVQQTTPSSYDSARTLPPPPSRNSSGATNATASYQHQPESANSAYSYPPTANGSRDDNKHSPSEKQVAFHPPYPPPRTFAYSTAPTANANDYSAPSTAWSGAASTGLPQHSPPQDLHMYAPRPRDLSSSQGEPPMRSPAVPGSAHSGASWASTMEGGYMVENGANAEGSPYTAHAVKTQEIIQSVLENCTAIINFSSRYRTLANAALRSPAPSPGTNGYQYVPPNAQVAEMVERATQVVRLLQMLRHRSLADTPNMSLPVARKSLPPDTGDSESVRSQNGDVSMESDNNVSRPFKRLRSVVGHETMDDGTSRPKYKKRSRAVPPGRCASCGITETPEWRKGPDGARTLCNACGLHFSKLSKQRERNVGPDGHPVDPPIDLTMLRSSARVTVPEPKGVSPTPVESPVYTTATIPTAPSVQPPYQPADHNTGSVSWSQHQTSVPSAEGYAQAPIGASEPPQASYPVADQSNGASSWVTTQAAPSHIHSTSPVPIHHEQVAQESQHTYWDPTEQQRSEVGSFGLARQVSNVRSDLQATGLNGWGNAMAHSAGRRSYIDSTQAHPSAPLGAPQAYT